MPPGFLLTSYRDLGEVIWQKFIQPLSVSSPRFPYTSPQMCRSLFAVVLPNYLFRLIVWTATAVMFAGIGIAAYGMFALVFSTFY
jgi:hypothetical protein